MDYRKLQKTIVVSLQECYKEAISENIKKGLRMAKNRKEVMHSQSKQK